MRGNPPETCASCTHFPRQALESGDKVQCTYREIVTAWDHRACVLWGYIRSEDERKIRRRLVEAREQNDNNQKGNP